jgi:mannose-6-phosphate isomerase
LIDGQADLSIQVHPDDRAATNAGLGTGKTEAYHILTADPGSVIYLGLDPDLTPDRFADACRLADGSAARCLRQIPARPGMTLLIPAGTPHALGAGITLYEIQQPSNVTFRLDDWGRVDATGQSRPLHLAEGFAVLTPDSRPEPISPVHLEDAPAMREILVATRYFALERIALETSSPVRWPAVASPTVLTCLQGSAMLDASGWNSMLRRGETAVVPVGLTGAMTGASSAVIMRGWVPDLERDIIAPARIAGISPDALERLGVFLDAGPIPAPVSC